MALASAPLPSAPGRLTYVLNGATFRGAYAVGGSVAYRLDTDRPIAARLGDIANQRAQKLDLSGVAALDPQLTLLPPLSRRRHSRPLGLPRRPNPSESRTRRGPSRKQRLRNGRRPRSLGVEGPGRVRRARHAPAPRSA